MKHKEQPVRSGLTMQEMFMKHPLGSTFEGEEVKGYRQTKEESALFTGEGAAAHWTAGKQ